MKQTPIQKESKGIAGVFIPAGFFIGFGLGVAFNNVPAGMFTGLGFGFLLFGITVLMKK